MEADKYAQEYHPEERRISYHQRRASSGSSFDECTTSSAADADTPGTASHDVARSRNTQASRASARHVHLKARGRAIIHELENLESNFESLAFGVRRNAVKRTTALKTVTEWSTLRIALLHVTESGLYNVGMVFIIILNVVHLWSETDMRAQKIETPYFMSFLSKAFLVIYTADLLLRVYVYRRQFASSGMNMFDALVVILDILLTALPGTQSNLPSMSVLRGLRMLRIVRVIRNLVAFRELYLMMQGLVSAVRAIIFGTALIFAALILWSILAVELVQEENLKLYQEGAYGDCHRCAYAFESVGHSMLTFISTIVAGDSWGVVALPLIERKPWTALILLPALLSLELGLLNVVAAVIVDRQAQARQDDEKFLHQMRDEELKKSYGRLMALFSSMDDDGSGSLTLEEMIHAYNHHSEFKELMELMDIQEDDLRMVFQILDKDRSGDVTYDEFVQQLNTMRTTNSHTLLVFIKHLAGRIHEQVEVADVYMKKVSECLGIIAPKCEKDEEESDFGSDPDEDAAVFSFRPGSVIEDAPIDSSNDIIARKEATEDSDDQATSMAMAAGRYHANGKSVDSKAKVKQAPVVKSVDATHRKVADVELEKPAHPSAWATRAAPHICQNALNLGNTSQTGYITAAAAADLNARFLALSRHIQQSLAHLTEDAVRQAGDKALWESTMAMATLQASLPHLHCPSQEADRPVAGVLRPRSLRQSNHAGNKRPPQRLVVSGSQPGPSGASCPRISVLEALMSLSGGEPDRRHEPPHPGRSSDVGGASRRPPKAMGDECLDTAPDPVFSPSGRTRIEAGKERGAEAQRNGDGKAREGGTPASGATTKAKGKYR